MTIIAREAGLSNAEVARRSGLTPQTVSAVLDDLDGRGLIARGEVRRGRRGQPATPLYIRPDGAFTLGVEIGWQHVEVILIEIGGKVRGHYRSEYATPDASTVFDIVGTEVRRMLDGLTGSERSRLVGLGLAAPWGFAEPDALLGLTREQTDLWARTDLVARTAQVTGIDDVQLINDGNAACWAEFGSFAAPRPKSCAFLLIDTFMGAGIIAEGRLWQGVSGASANLGSMLVSDQKGAPTFGHEIASLWALGNRLKAVGATYAEAVYDQPTAAALSVLNVWIEDSAFAIAQTFLNTYTVLEFELAILESVLPMRWRDALVSATERHLQQIPSLGRTRPTLVAGHLGRSGAALGAAQLRLYRRFFSRELEHMSA